MDYQIDGIIFFISNILLFIYVFKNKSLNFKEKLCYFLFFVVLNCSYNIMIKRVHDYNLVIPRTYIYRQKFFKSFSFLDLFCIFIIVKNFGFLISTILKNKLILKTFIRDILIYMVAVFSFFLIGGYWLDGGSSFLSASKGFVYSLTTLILTFKYMKKNLKLIVPFAIILINGWISTLLIQSSQLWIRYGHVVSIIDQDDAYSISLFLIVLLFTLSIRIDNNKKWKLNMSYFTLFVIFLFQNLYCLYKTNLIFLPLMLLLYFVIINPKVLLMILSCIIPSGCLIFFNQIYYLFTSLAIQTRLGQLSDLLNYMKTLSFSRYIFGIGLGTPYYSTTDTGDLGEIKLVDVSNTKALNYRINIQTPIISTFKDAGIFGVIILLVYTISIWKSIISTMHSTLSKYYKIDRYLFCETLACAIYFCVSILSWYAFFGGTLPIVIFSIFCLCKFIINIEKIKNLEVDVCENTTC